MAAQREGLPVSFQIPPLPFEGKDAAAGISGLRSWAASLLNALRVSILRLLEATNWLLEGNVNERHRYPLQAVVVADPEDGDVVYYDAAVVGVNKGLYRYDGGAWNFVG